MVLGVVCGGSIGAKLLFKRNSNRNYFPAARSLCDSWTSCIYILEHVLLSKIRTLWLWLWLWLGPVATSIHKVQPEKKIRFFFLQSGAQHSPQIPLRDLKVKLRFYVGLQFYGNVSKKRLTGNNTMELYVPVSLQINEPNWRLYDNAIMHHHYNISNDKKRQPTCIKSITNFSRILRYNRTWYYKLTRFLSKSKLLRRQETVLQQAYCNNKTAAAKCCTSQSTRTLCSVDNERRIDRLL